MMTATDTNHHHNVRCIPVQRCLEPNRWPNPIKGRPLHLFPPRAPFKPIETKLFAHEHGSCVCVCVFGCFYSSHSEGKQRNLSAPINIVICVAIGTTYLHDFIIYKSKHIRVCNGSFSQVQSCTSSKLFYQEFKITFTSNSHGVPNSTFHFT